MICLDATNKTLQAALGASASTTNPQVTVVFFDENIEGTDTKHSSKQTDMSHASDVTICDAPIKDFTRNIEYVSLYNADSQSASVMMKIDISGSDTNILKVILASGESLHYDNKGGWYALTTAGARK